MDTHWDLSDWKPSIDSETALEWESPSPEVSSSYQNCSGCIFLQILRQALLKLQNQLKENAARVVNNPYSPQAWTERANILLDLGYPELAAADCWKSILLFDSAIDEDGKLGEDVGTDNLTLHMKVVCFRRQRNARF